MAVFANITDVDGFNAWVASRPPVVQDLIKLLPPDRLYKLSPTNSRVVIHSYSEDGTLTVDVSGEFNCTLFERRVFGVKPDTLLECDLPGKKEKLGVILSMEDRDKFIEAMRIVFLRANQ